MRKSIVLSGVALSALMLGMAPVGAISLNIGGGGGLVTIDGGSSDSGGGSSGGDGGSSGGGLLGGGPLVDLSGDDNVDAAVDVDLGIGSNGGSGGGVLGNNGIVDLDTGGDDGVIVDLFGRNGAIADVELGITGDGDGLVDLDTDGQNGIIVDLFGEGSAVADVELPLGSDGPLGGTSAVIDLFGPDVDGTATGGIPPVAGNPGGGAGTGSDGDGGAGDLTTGSGGSAISPGLQHRAPKARVASTAAAGKSGCFSPDQQQIAHLLARHSYTADVTARFEAAEKVRLVPINLCADAKARLDAALAGDANIGALHQAIATDAQISAALEPRYQPDDVLAADQSGEDLTVYVY